jgi:Xaa-Pro aminopeptidase
MHADSHKELQELRNEIATLKVDIVHLPGMMAKVTQQKNAEEEVYINNAKNLAFKAMAYATNNLKVGQSEAEAASLIAAKATEMGASPHQHIRVAADEARAWPQGDANLGTLSGGTTGATIPVTVEIQVELEGYPAAMCRTFPVGGEFRPADLKVATQLKESHAELLTQLKPGASLTQVVAGRAASNDKRLKAAGIYKSDAGPELAPLFHDVKVMDTRFSDDHLPEKLAPGMILYVKTGVYFQSTKGIQPEYLQSSMEIGDMVRITESGCEVLTKALEH